MLNFGNKEFRNLQEQVLENAKNIEILQETPSLSILFVDELPETGKAGYLYLVPKNPDPDDTDADSYDEYIWLEDSEEFELVGTTAIDLSNMVTTDTTQTISGAKSFSSAPLPSSNNSVDLGSSDYTWKDIYMAGNLTFGEISGNPVLLKMDSGYITFSIGTTNAILINSSQFFSRGVLPVVNNYYDLGTSANKYKDLYLAGELKLYNSSNSWEIKTNSSNYIDISYNGSNRLQIRPTLTYPSGNFDIGTNAARFKDLYLNGNVYIAGNLSDDVNTVTVANIASKVTSTYASGTFDANGESTIDISGGEPEGLFIFTYGNCQCFLRLTATMVQNADITPIRASCPMIYNSATTLGWLNISRTSTTLTISVIDSSNHVDSGYAWTLTKTNLI